MSSPILLIYHGRGCRPSHVSKGANFCARVLNFSGGRVLNRAFRRPRKLLIAGRENCATKLSRLLADHFFLAVFAAEQHSAQGINPSASSSDFSQGRRRPVSVSLMMRQELQARLKLLQASDSNAYPVISIAHVVLKYWGLVNYGY